MSRARSPNYPALSLPQAIDRARAVYEKQQLRPETKEIVVQHMGYNSVNGRSSKSLSALLKFGLIDEVDGEFHVTERAMSIFFPDGDGDKENAIISAAHSPKLYRNLFERYDGVKPTPESLEGYLVRQGFIPKAVEAVAKSFGETFDFVQEQFTDNSGDALLSAADKLEEIQSNFQPSTQNKPTVSPAASGFTDNFEGIELNCTKPVFDFETVKIVTTIDNQSDLQNLMDRLTAIKPLLPERPKKVETNSGGVTINL